jgi:hypothetical protein
MPASATEREGYGHRHGQLALPGGVRARRRPTPGDHAHRSGDDRLHAQVGQHQQCRHKDEAAAHAEQAGQQARGRAGEREAKRAGAVHRNRPLAAPSRQGARRGREPPSAAQIPPRLQQRADGRAASTAREDQRQGPFGTHLRPGLADRCRRDRRPWPSGRRRDSEALRARHATRRRRRVSATSS